MADEKMIRKVFRRLVIEEPSDRDTSLVGDLLDDAEAYILDRIDRNVMPERLRGVQTELAIIAYNRLGAEGESSRSVGGISRSFEMLPPEIEKQFQNYPRKVGVIHV